MDYEFVPGRDDFPPDEIAMLRQQLAAALAACEAKDKALVYHQEQTRPIQRTIEALAIQPDASALKAHDAALIERCSDICMEYERASQAAAAIRKLKKTVCHQNN